jgi:hypothetical protein
LCLEFLRQLLAQGATFGRSRPIRLQREALIGRNLDPALDGCAHGDHATHQFGKLARASARIWK